MHPERSGEHVDALDRSPVMLEQARRRCAAAPNPTWIEGDLLDHDVALSADGYDAITAVSSLHHMPIQPALRRLAELLRPGGVPVVVGHYRPDTAADHALELVRMPADAVVGTTLALRGRAGKPDDEGMPVLPPTTTLAEVQRAVTARLPDATLQRAL